MNKPYIVGIAGGSGSGKTFFLRRFLKHFSPDQVCLVSQDDYYIPVGYAMTPEQNKFYNFDLPATIDNDSFERDINDLLNKKTVVKQEYTFNNPNATPKTLEIKPAPVLIVEGLFILHFRNIADRLDLKIFMDADNDIALQRRMRRDLLERGYSNEDVYYKWVNHVVPSYNQYLLPYKSECHHVISNNTDVAADIVKMSEKIANKIRHSVF
ncbi:uridine kinase [Mucilaginibacter hurinus]|uniref:Uridine kinase n=1 Tax=Mucilaginibacter hurinus TaxID=2201324 RepID=A0A367GRU0_9SPHI|nr:uridine kinase [Mucilaginibacter hurinus]RCH55805.1 uridine kinase [Mucilaginibacter hurinus]